MIINNKLLNNVNRLQGLHDIVLSIKRHTTLCTRKLERRGTGVEGNRDDAEEQHRQVIQHTRSRLLSLATQMLLVNNTLNERASILHLITVAS